MSRIVVALVYPGCTLLDLVGPLTVFAALPNTTVQLCWKTPGPIVSDNGIVLVAERALHEAHRTPDVLLVPGGAQGTMALVHDEPLLSWLRASGESAAWVTSVCTGSLLLGAAGLLCGYRASSHWVARDALALFGAIPSAERVTFDRNRATGGGVTAGIDFGLALAARLESIDVARRIQLELEYAPAPPFSGGTPGDADAALKASVVASFAPDVVMPILERAAMRVQTR